MKALIWILVQAALDHALQRGRSLGSQLGDGRGFFVQNRRHRLRGRRLLEGSLAGQHLVENRAECKYVAAMVNRLSAHLFG